MSTGLQILLFLALVAIASKGAGALSRRLGQPAVFGEILAGLLLGPSLLDILTWPVFRAPGGAPSTGLAEVVDVLAQIGVILLMFIAGMETDLREMRRVGKAASWAALGGVLLPLLGGAAAARLFDYGWREGIFMGTVLTATSVSISAQTLMELSALRSKEGSTILGAAVIDDVIGIILLSLVVAFAGGAAQAHASSGAAVSTILWITARMILFFALAWFAGRRYLVRLAAACDRLGVAEPLLAMAIAVAFLYAFTAEALGGVAAITGSYMAGALFGETPFKERIDRGVHPLGYAFFVPVFFIHIGLRADVRQVTGAIPLTVFILVVAVLGKIVGCGVGARLAGFRADESLRVGVGMISRGEVGLIVAGYGLAHGIIGADIFSVMVLMVLVTTLITPVGMRLVFRRAPEKRGPLPDS